MNTLRGQYSFIAQFLGGQPVEPEKTYRQLSFCRTVDVDGETVVFNVLTGEIAALTAAGAAILRAPAVLPGAETAAGSSCRRGTTTSGFRRRCARLRWICAGSFR